MILTGVDSLSTLSILKKKWKESVVNNFKETLTRRKNLLNRGPCATLMIKSNNVQLCPKDCWLLISMNRWNHISGHAFTFFCPVQGLYYNFILATCERKKLSSDLHYFVLRLLTQNRSSTVYIPKWTVMVFRPLNNILG